MRQRGGRTLTEIWNDKGERQASASLYSKRKEEIHYMYVGVLEGFDPNPYRPDL